MFNYSPRHESSCSVTAARLCPCLCRSVQGQRKQPEHALPGGGSHPSAPPGQPAPVVPPWRRASLRQRRADVPQRVRHDHHGLAERHQAEEGPRRPVQKAGYVKQFFFLHVSHAWGTVGCTSRLENCFRSSAFQLETHKQVKTMTAFFQGNLAQAHGSALFKMYQCKCEPVLDCNRSGDKRSGGLRVSTVSVLVVASPSPIRAPGLVTWATRTGGLRINQQTACQLLLYVR